MINRILTKLEDVNIIQLDNDKTLPGIKTLIGFHRFITKDFQLFMCLLSFVVRRLKCIGYKRKYVLIK